MPSVAQPDARPMANNLLRSIAMDSTSKPALTTICGICEKEWPTDSGLVCPKCGNDGEFEAHVIRDEADFPEAIADPLAEYKQLERRVRIEAAMRQTQTGERALAARSVADVWRRELPIQDPRAALALRIIREAQRSCLAIVERWAPNQTEEFYLGLIQGIIADDRPDRTSVEREVITHYRAVKAQARARQGDAR